MHYDDIKIKSNGVAHMLDDKRKLTFCNLIDRRYLGQIMYVKISTLPEIVQRKIRENFN